MRRCYSRYPYTRRDVDITASDDVEGTKFAHSLQLREVFNNVQTFSCCNTFPDLPKNFHTNCNLLVLDFGSNDLANLSRESEHFVHKLAEFFLDWAVNSRAKHILVLGILPRSQGLRSSVGTFESNRICYNKYMKHLCKMETRALCTFRKLQGFEGFDHVVPRPVRSWSNDGIHPTTMCRYAHRLKFAMIHSIKKTKTIIVLILYQACNNMFGIFSMNYACIMNYACTMNYARYDNEL